MIYHYKIRSKSTGKFKNGGSDVRWGSTGKVWRGTGPLRNHLNLFNGKIPPDWEVVEYQMVENTVKPAHEYINLLKVLGRR